MNANHHIIAGAAGAGAYLYGTAATPETIILCVSMAVLGSLLPDIDHPQSWINRVLFPLRLVCLVVTHRGITHTLWMLAALAALAFTYLPMSAATGLIIGYASHLVLDAITPAGIRPLYPLRWRIRF